MTFINVNNILDNKEKNYDLDLHKQVVYLVVKH